MIHYYDLRCPAGLGPAFLLVGCCFPLQNPLVFSFLLVETPKKTSHLKDRYQQLVLLVGNIWKPIKTLMLDSFLVFPAEMVSPRSLLRLPLQAMQVGVFLGVFSASYTNTEAHTSNVSSFVRLFVLKKHGSRGL